MVGLAQAASTLAEVHKGKEAGVPLLFPQEAGGGS